eukprot:6296440-Amphidinium_carterae.1
MNCSCAGIEQELNRLCEEGREEPQHAPTYVVPCTYGERRAPSLRSIMLSALDPEKKKTGRGFVSSSVWRACLLTTSWASQVGDVVVVW